MAAFTEVRTRKVDCPYCHNSKVVKNGQNANGKQTYLCKSCGKRFLHTGQVAGRHATAEQIGMAIRMYLRRHQLQADRRDDGGRRPVPPLTTTRRNHK